LHLQLKVEAYGGAYEHLTPVVDTELQRGHLGPSAPYLEIASSAPIEILFDWIRVSP
jgi:hypothetical protein